MMELGNGSGSKVVPSPYMWTPQPQRGTAAGASQDYSTRMNTMSAGPRLNALTNGIRATRNSILMNQAMYTETPRPVMNPPVWPAATILRQADPPVTVTLPRDESLEEVMVDEGAQLAGGGAVRVRVHRRGGLGAALPLGAAPYGLRSAPPAYVTCPAEPHLRQVPIRGAGLQLNDEHISSGVLWRGFPSAGRTALRSDGVFQLGGSGPIAEGPGQAQFLTLQSLPSVPRSGGIGEVQFVREFVPTVYLNPFSGGPGTYPDQFQSNYNIVTETVQGYD